MTIHIMKIFKDSFKNVWNLKLEWIRVACAPFIIWIAGMLYMVIAYASVSQSLQLHEIITGKMINMEFTEKNQFLIGSANIVYLITYFIALINLSINGFRYAVLQEGGNRWLTLNLNWRFVKTILYSLLIAILAGIYFLIAGGVTIGTQFLIESKDLMGIIGALFVIYAIYLFTRIGLIGLLISIDQRAPLKTSWYLLKGNVLRLFVLLFLIGIAFVLLALIGMALLGILGWTINLWLNWPPMILVSLFGLLMWFFNWAVSSKALALVYNTVTKEERESNKQEGVFYA